MRSAAVRPVDDHWRQRNANHTPKEEKAPVIPSVLAQYKALQQSERIIVSPPVL
jgi:hypothetical protein